MKKAEWQNWMNLVLGLILFITPWVLDNSLSSEVATLVNWNFWIVGVVVITSAASALKNLKPWEEWVNLILGVWMILSPWALSYTTENNLVMVSIISGLAITLFAGLALPIARKLQARQ